jgi:hypothetical protein
MKPRIQVKRIGYGLKLSKTSKLVYAIIDPKTGFILEGKNGPLVFSLDATGLAKAKQALPATA